MNGAYLESQATLRQAREADAVIVGSGMLTRDIVKTPTIMDELQFDPGRQLATAGGCLASQYLACWVIARLVGLDAAADAIHYVAPVGEKDNYVSRALGNIERYMPDDPVAANHSPGNTLAHALPVP